MRHSDDALCSDDDGDCAATAADTGADAGHANGAVVAAGDAVAVAHAMDADDGRPDASAVAAIAGVADADDAQQPMPHGDPLQDDVCRSSADDVAAVLSGSDRAVVHWAMAIDRPKVVG